MKIKYIITSPDIVFRSNISVPGADVKNTGRYNATDPCEAATRASAADITDATRSRTGQRASHECTSTVQTPPQRAPPHPYRNTMARIIRTAATGGSTGDETVAAAPPPPIKTAVARPNNRKFVSCDADRSP